nr:hypothetical protein KSU1_C1516 [uncultured bacterium]
MNLDLTATTLTLAEIYSLELKNGVTILATSYKAELVYQGYTYKPAPLRRGKIKYNSDLQVDSVSLAIGTVGIAIGGDNYTIPQAIRRGFFREARVKITLVDPLNLAAIGKPLFDGYVRSAPSFSGGALELKISSILDRLQDKFPKFIYTEQCQHRVFDAYCGLVAATWLESGAVAAGSTLATIVSPVFAFSAHPRPYWAKGRITFTSGGLSSVSASILNHRDGAVDLMLPLPEAPAVDDAFDVLPGCDRTGVTCADKFDNYANFFGFEYIPNPELLIADLSK